MEIKETSHRTIIFQMIKDAFKEYAAWMRIEPEVAKLCIEIPESTTFQDKGKLIESLERIKKYLLNQSIEKDKLEFLDEEINRYKDTVQISLYNEEDDSLDFNIIQAYKRMVHNTEGVVGISPGYNYKQLSKLTNSIYRETGKIKFYISREVRLSGKVLSEVYEHPQQIPIAYLVESIQKDREAEMPLYKKVYLFGEKFNRREVNIIREVPVSMRVYRFISEENQEFFLLSTKPVNAGDCIITGVTTHVDDLKSLTDSARLSTKLPYLFVQTCEDRIIKFDNHQEFKKRLITLKVSKRNLYDLPFTVIDKGVRKKLLQPDWFKRLIWAWMLHSNKGLSNKYPLHLMILGIQNSGKSFLFNGIHALSKEIRDIFSGSSSTLKSLVPSFKYNPARHGYLAESNRFAFCDEFFNCLVRARNQAGNKDRDDSVAMMNDLLEHQKREAGSAVSRARPNMTARVILAGNPPKGVHCLEDLSNFLAASFLSRWLIYYQKEEHVNLIRDAKHSDLKLHPYSLEAEDFVALTDYLQTFDAEYDRNKLEKILRSVFPILSEKLRDHYQSRHRHHIEALMDGVVKTRCLMEKDISFCAKEEDYETLKKIWMKVIGSWIDNKYITHLPINYRIYYLPEDAQYLFRRLAKYKAPMNRNEFREIALREMELDRFLEIQALLMDLDIIKEKEGWIKPYYMKDEKIEN